MRLPFYPTTWQFSQFCTNRCAVFPSSKGNTQAVFLVGFNNPQELFRVCLFVVEWLHKRRSKGRKEGMESQSSPLEERSKIRYYELPSLPTFAKKILSIRAQSELEQGDAIRLKITRTTRPRRRRTTCATTHRFGFTTRCDTIRSWKDARSAGREGGRTKVCLLAWRALT